MDVRRAAPRRAPRPTARGMLLLVDPAERHFRTPCRGRAGDGSRGDCSQSQRRRVAQLQADAALDRHPARTSSAQHVLAHPCVPFSLRNNSIGAEGAKLIGEGLKLNKALTSLKCAPPARPRAPMQRITCVRSSSGGLGRRTTDARTH